MVLQGGGQQSDHGHARNGLDFTYQIQAELGTAFSDQFSAAANRAVVQRFGFHCAGNPELRHHPPQVRPAWCRGVGKRHRLRLQQHGTHRLWRRDVRQPRAFARDDADANAGEFLSAAGLHRPQFGCFFDQGHRHQNQVCLIPRSELLLDGGHQRKGELHPVPTFSFKLGRQTAQYGLGRAAAEDADICSPQPAGHGR